MNKEELRNLDIESINVKLKDVFGIKPKYYLSGIYAIMIIAILFFLFLYPGIRKNGTWTYINSSMSGSAVFVDGRYLGSTPGRFFIPKGMREITVRYPYFNDFTKSENVKGRILFSLFAPRKATLDCRLDVIDAQGLYDAGLREAASWGLIDMVKDSYQPYPVISRTAAGLVTSGHLALAESFINEALAQVSNEYMFADWLQADATVLAGGFIGGSIYSSLAMADFLKRAERYPNLSYLLYYINSNSEERAKLRSSDRYKKLNARIAAMESSAEAGTVSGKKLNLNGLSFIRFDKGSFVSGSSADNLGIDLRGTASHPVKINVDEFYMLDREVTRGMYRHFLASNPEWNLDRLDDLVKFGFAGKDYLAGWENGKDNEPADYISWHAAESFCKYLDGFLPDRLKKQGYSVQLPTSAMLEYASLKSEQPNPVFQNNNFLGPLPVNGRTPDGNGIYDLAGNLWEWCREWYAPAGRFYTDFEGNSPVQLANGSEKNIRGGSWANSSADLTLATRAFQPPEWCTPYLGFRVVISRD